MRFWSFAAVLLFTECANAQDSTQQLLQLQQQQQMQLSQQQIAQQQLDLINQQQLTQAANTNLAGYRLGVRAPRLRQLPSPTMGSAVATMEDASRGASIFYTTDGWTPTAVSSRYVGPVTVRQGTTLRAIAIAPGGFRSYVSVLPVYTGAKPSTPQIPGANGLHQTESETQVSLVFTDSVSSRGEKVGNRLPIDLAEDLVLNGKLVAVKGTPVDAFVTQVDNSHVQGLPGVLSFTVQSIHLQDGSTVALLGLETMEGEDHTKKANVISIVPLAGLAVHGGDALIPAGARLQAVVKGPVGQTKHPESE